MRFIGVISLFLLAWLGADGWLARGQGYSHRLLLFACSSTASQNNHNHAQPSSVHLQLQNIQSTFTDTNIHNKEKKLTSFAYLHAFVNIANHSDILTACTSATASNISIDSLDNFSQFPTNEEDTKAFARLVYFSRHILMQQWPYVEQERDKQELPSFTRLTHNDTQISYGGIVYRYQTLNIPLDDEDQFRLYEQLWRSGRLLLRYRSLEDEWDSFRQDEDGLKQKANLNKLTFEQLLVSNVFKRIVRTSLVL